jgi:lysophospholipase L1-like esterase
MTRKFRTCLAGLSLAASLVAVSAIPLVSALAQGQDAPPAAQAPAAPAAPQTPTAPARFDDHQNMMDQLGITKLRPGRNGQNQTGEGFEEATANPYKDTMPDALTMKDGTKVTRADQWPKRRAEILEDFEREVYGRIPPNVPKVTWEVTGTTEGNSGGIPTITKTLVGHVDNSEYPQITVNIQAGFTVPAGATGPVPLLVEFGGFGGGFGPRRGGPGAAAPGGPAGAGAPPAAGAGAPAAPAAGAATPPATGGAPAAPATPQNTQTAQANPPAAGGPAAAPAQAGPGGPAGPGGRGFGRGPGGPSWQQQAIAHGWGYGNINPGSIQPDNNQLRSGIIGLTNKGQPRKPDDWGALRAWQWGVSRLIDYFEANPDSKVDPTKVAIEGVSRYGKAALVAEAFEPRVAVAFVASSGEGGAKLHRHIFGEAVENLTGGEYYWMAGNFIKYGAAEPFTKTAADLPVDSHQLIALCAPRPCFISYGIEPGDPKWVDAHGSFMAGVLAGPVYKLLGKKDLGTPGDYLTDPMPAVGQLIGGELAFRQHEGGHTSVPNFPAFFEWIANYIKAPALPQPPAAASPSASTSAEPAPAAPAASAPASQAQPAAAAVSQAASETQPARGFGRGGFGGGSAAQATPRTDANSQLAHQQMLEKAKKGRIDVYFVGDSITRRWGASDSQYKAMLANWNENFFGWNAADFGWGADSIQHILWRLENGELDGVNPKAIVILAGTNNVSGARPGDDARVADISAGIKAILSVCQEKAPQATIILTAIFPRSGNNMATIDKVNENIAKFTDGKKIRFLNVNGKLADENGKLFDGMMVDGLHPTVKGYQVWADGLKPILTELLGPPAKEDHAPPPTGDPSAMAKSSP